VEQARRMGFRVTPSQVRAQAQRAAPPGEFNFKGVPGT
jgi:hypothetical protein